MRSLMAAAFLVIVPGLASAGNQANCIKVYNYGDDSSELGNQCRFPVVVMFCSNGGGCTTSTLSGFQSRVKLNGNFPNGGQNNAGGFWIACDGSDSPRVRGGNASCN